MKESDPTHLARLAEGATKYCLTVNEQRLLEMISEVKYGRILNLYLRNGRVVFSPAPEFERQHRLGADDSFRPRPRCGLGDFPLKRHQIDLFNGTRSLKDGVIDIHIHEGLPTLINEHGRFHS